MAENTGPTPAMLFQCGPSSTRCKCECGNEPRGTCEHKWDGPWIELGDGGMASCSRCGMTADSHDMWTAP